MSLASDMRRASARFKADADRKMRGTCMELSNRIVKRTPVGNPDLWQSPPPAGYIGGTLRNAWRASVGAPSNDVGTRPDEGANEATASLGVAVSGLQSGETFYLTNNMPYAKRVEDGWSTQAPAGMVGITIAEAKRVAEGKFRG